MPDRSKRIYEMKRPPLSSKLCKVCGDVIERTRRVAKEWERIQYCSAVCRRVGSTRTRIASAS